MTTSELAFNVEEESLDCVTMADYVIHNDPCVGIIANGDVHRHRECLPLVVDIVNEIDERCRSVRGSKGHDCISPFNSIWALKSKFLLAGRLDSKLMVAQWGVKKPHELANP